MNRGCRARNRRRCLFDTNIGLNVTAEGEEEGVNITGIKYDQCFFLGQGANGVAVGYNCLTFPTKIERIQNCCIFNPENCDDMINIFNEIVNSAQEPTTEDFLQLFSKCGNRTAPFLDTCANDCPGVEPSDIVAGGAAVFAAAAIALSAPLPALPLLPGLLGVAGLGLAAGGVVMTQQCMGPLFCTTASGDCCLIVNTESGLQCPPSC